MPPASSKAEYVGGGVHIGAVVFEIWHLIWQHHSRWQH